MLKIFALIYIIFTANKSMEFVEHPLIKEKAIERRAYQEKIFAEAAGKNLMCVLPTGLGKTSIAILLTAYKLQKNPDGKILVLAPTKPLAEQHHSSFKKFMNLPEGNFKLITGKTPKALRKEIWKEGKIFFATPQAVENDLISKFLNLKTFSLLIFDECHRAVGNYAYVYIAKNYVKNNSEAHILALTASPGSEREKISEVMQNLFIEKVESRTEFDRDVKAYVREKKIKWYFVELPENFLKAKKFLELALKETLGLMKKEGIIKTLEISKREILALRGKIASKISENRNPENFRYLSLIARAMKLYHAIELLETQGVSQTYKYYEKLKKEKSSAAKAILNDKNSANAFAMVQWLYMKKYEHPKINKLAEILQDFSGKAIVFTQYRASANLICENLLNNGIKAEVFLGQKEGYTQKKQLETIQSFKRGEFNIIVSTSVGEEGIDIPKVNLVIFYEPVPSAIRTIQRKGRTARTSAGKIIFLIAKNTKDEIYYWGARGKEKRMREIIKTLGGENFKVRAKNQATLHAYSMQNNAVVIICDDREKEIAKNLSDFGIEVKIDRLDVGDFILSDRVAVERKTDRDFVNSIIDKRIFEQAKMMNESFEIPIFMIEGKEFYLHRDMNENAIRGAIISLTIDYRIPIIFSSSPRETSSFLALIARREQLDFNRRISIRGEKRAMSPEDLQKFIVSGLPNVNVVLAERLLETFGSVRRVFNAEEHELRKIEGIGEKKAKMIRQIIDQKWKKI